MSVGKILTAIVLACVIGFFGLCVVYELTGPVPPGPRLDSSFHMHCEKRVTHAPNGDETYDMVCGEVP